jgi:hypothetical protein
MQQRTLAAVTPTKGAIWLLDPSPIGDGNFNHVKIERRVEACKRGEERRVSGGIYDALRLKGQTSKKLPGTLSEASPAMCAGFSVPRSQK